MENIHSGIGRLSKKIISPTLCPTKILNVLKKPSNIKIPYTVDKTLKWKNLSNKVGDIKVLMKGC